MKVVSCCLDRLPRELKGEIMTLLIYADVANWAEATRDPVVAAVATHRWQCTDKMLRAFIICERDKSPCRFYTPLVDAMSTFKWPKNKKDEDGMMTVMPVQIAKSRMIKLRKYAYLQEDGEPPPNKYMLYFLRWGKKYYWDDLFLNLDDFNAYYEDYCRDIIRNRRRNPGVCLDFPVLPMYYPRNWELNPTFPR